MSIHTVKEIIASLERKESKPSEWTETALRMIERHNPELGAFLTVDGERALAHARRLDGEAFDGFLFGVPYALKDNICTRNLKTTAASRILENYIPPYDATVAERLAETHGVLVGKTNMDEFAMGSSTENSAFQKTHNPYDLERVPGGSSGGSAAAVAAGMVPFALGSDTGGSIRQPASYCGVVGLKPTYGRVSRYGLIAFASSLDQIGPFTRTVEDAAYVLEAISGHDERDSTSARQEVPRFVDALAGGVKGLRIGLVTGLDEHGVDAEVKAAVDKAVKALENAGAEVVEISLPHLRYAVATYYLIAPAEASSNLARYDGVRYGRRVAGETLLEMYQHTRSEGFGMEVKRRIMIGTYALSSGYYDAYYRRAQQVRTRIREDFDKAFERCDVIVMPTTPTTAFRMGEKVDNPLQMYLNDIFTIPANLAGLPALSVPCGVSSEGLPIGLQLLAHWWDEATLLRVGHTYEQVRGFEMPLPRMGA
ncbi:MAG: Asp-tRNA(Asn)/Glu-tRNA(Gln) amidotransferase subunit GatA [Alicyclobacillus herbarius]|uniref:Asp-tRNA(Asn)/Glu-tRNA(Gln) amidotransferase subunit GatA n=1 Tax=Alicyclobacillus herbarius TaxID=122960 RepID=UPI00235233E9|nr:Asp-tRNA(Asn)/Glu-tRNA(Gln) amidotransferase subunit GatA [Alicyclobacillus herbarius]MCL6633513.1 Asp-tRNA(Asn)/Glu-tRNA(Gln) amidotransferase subunit GatA [Alicyclobacillus herbarius]